MRWIKVEMNGLLYKNDSHSFFVMATPTTLAQAPTGVWARIAENGSVLPRLQALGFLPLERVCVLRRSRWRSGALVVQVGDAVFALRPHEA